MNKNNEAEKGIKDDWNPRVVKKRGFNFEFDVCVCVFDRGVDCFKIGSSSKWRGSDVFKIRKEDRFTELTLKKKVLIKEKADVIAWTVRIGLSRVRFTCRDALFNWEWESYKMFELTSSEDANWKASLTILRFVRVNFEQLLT